MYKMLIRLKETMETDGKSLDNSEDPNVSENDIKIDEL